MNRDAFLIAYLKVYAADLLIAGPQYAIVADTLREVAKRLEELSSAEQNKPR